MARRQASPDFYHGIFWSEENIHPNYFQTQMVYQFVMSYNLIGHMII